MKYLQDDRLSAITARLLTPDLVELAQGPSAGRGLHRIGASGGASGAMMSSRRSSCCRRVRGKIEAYTTKRTSTDKKYASHLGIKYVTSLQRHNSSVEVGVVEPPQQEMTLALGPDATNPTRVLVAAGSTAAPPLGAIEKKRRAHSVGFTGDGSSGSTTSNKKPRSRSNSLDENVLSYHTALGDFAAQETRRLMTDFVLTLNMSFPDYDFEEISPNDFEKVPLPQVVQHVQSLLLSDATASPTPVQQAVLSSPGLIPPDSTISTLPGAPEQGGLNLNLAWKGDVDGDGSVSEFAYEVASTVDPLEDAAPGSDPSRNGSNSSSSSNMLAELWLAMDSVIRLGDCEVYRWTNPPEGLLSGDNDDEYDADSDDDDVVTVWSFYYLFVNKSLKRIVFFCCSETLVNRHPTSASVNGDAYMDEEENGPLAGVRDDGNDRDGLRDVDLVSEQDNGDDDDDDDEDEDGIVTSSQHYKMMMSSADASSSEADFDLDPAAVTAGGIPISTV
jgi:Maf1 regulator